MLLSNFLRDDCLNTRAAQWHDMHRRHWTISLKSTGGRYRLRNIASSSYLNLLFLSSRSRINVSQPLNYNVCRALSALCVALYPVVDRVLFSCSPNHLETQQIFTQTPRSLATPQTILHISHVTSVRLDRICYNTYAQFYIETCIACSPAQISKYNTVNGLAVIATLLYLRLGLEACQMS